MKYLLIIATTLLPICTILYGHETSENLIDNTAIAPPRMNHLAEGKAGPTVSRDDETLDNRDDKQRRRHFLGFGGGKSKCGDLIACASEHL